MTFARLLSVAVILMLVGSGIVLLKAEQVQLSHQTASLELRAVQLRRRLWKQQLEIARLRSPDLVHARHAQAAREVNEAEWRGSIWAAVPGDRSSTTSHER